MKCINILRVLKIAQVHSNHLLRKQKAIIHSTGKIERKVVLCSIPQRHNGGVDV
jgi:hypothetical protein